MLTRSVFLFFFNDTATTEIYTLSLHDALPIWQRAPIERRRSIDQKAQHHLAAIPVVGIIIAIEVDELRMDQCGVRRLQLRSEEHTSELQSRLHLVCRLLLEKKKKQTTTPPGRR